MTPRLPPYWSRALPRHKERSMRHTLRLLFMIVIILLPAATAGSAFAQTTATSSITGVVVDADGGVVPGANVIVKSESTGAESTAVTSSTGGFNVPALNP